MRFLVDAASNGLITLERIAEITSTKPAELFHYDSKGRIDSGYDADLVLYDLEAESEVRDEDLLGIIGWSPYAGLKTKGVPVRTVLRGKTIFADGQVTGETGGGKQVVATRS